MGGSRLDGAGSGLWALSIVLGRVIRWSLVQDGGRTFMGEGGVLEDLEPLQTFVQWAGRYRGPC